MFPSGFITLTTDFGIDSPYVAAMKGVILTICPTARIFDVCHSVKPQNIYQGALTLEKVARFFPPGTVHIAVVDPGVGTSRDIILAQIGDYYYIAPNNGLLTRVIRQAELDKVSMKFRSLENRGYWREAISNTFHGRDVMAPAAAHLLCGMAPQYMGVLTTSIVKLEIPEPAVSPTEIIGIVEDVDSFGNLITNISAKLLAGRATDDSVQISLSGRVVTQGVCRTYGDKPAGEVIAIIDSSNSVEIAVVNGNAAQTFKAAVGDTVVLSWA
ncbi:MAG: SAM-dependent chlorinase/fluorinase [Thermoguttaceae bacterium]|nr:SAM-dependent chlorinase/fluorinase [Thermoguttaceae bacterium]